jgi:hypothetical protein
LVILIESMGALRHGHYPLASGLLAAIREGWDQEISRT